MRRASTLSSRGREEYDVRVLRFSALFAASVLATSAASSVTTAGETSARAADAGSEPPRRFYGWQIFLTAHVGQALVIHGFLSDSYTPIVVGAGTWLSGGVAVHGAHGNGGAALASPAIQASPLVLAAIGSQFGKRRDGEEIATVTLVVGAIVAPLLDGLLLGWERSPTRSPTHRAPAGLSLQVAPNVARDRFGLFLGGQF